MTGDGDGEWIGRAGTRHRAHRFRRADGLRYIGIARGLARRDLTQGLPHALLERCAAYIKGQVEAQCGCFDKTNYLGDEPLKILVARDEVRTREAVLEIAGEGIGVFAQENGANTAIACRDQDRAERALRDREAYLGSGAARTVTCGRHAEDLIRFFIEASVRVVASAVDRVGYAPAAYEFRANASFAMGRRIRFRRQARHGLEDAMQMIGTETDTVGHCLEPGRLFGVLDEAADLRHAERILLGQGELIGSAAFARAKSRTFGIRGGKMELHVLRPRRPGWTGGIAVHPGGLNRVEEPPIGRPIARHYRGPARIVLDGGG